MVNVNELRKQKAAINADIIELRKQMGKGEIQPSHQSALNTLSLRLAEVQGKLDDHEAGAHAVDERDGVRAIVGPGWNGNREARPSPRSGLTLTGENEETGGAMTAISEFMKTGKIIEANSPLHIYQSPVSGGLAAAIPTEVLDLETTYLRLDPFRLAGSTIYATDSTIPLVKPIVSAGPDADTFVEGVSATNSDPMQVDAFTFHGDKYARLVRVSEESLMNSALDLSSVILDELATGIANSVSKVVSSQIQTALEGNSTCYVPKGSDVYHALLGLTLAVPPRYDRPTNAFMMSRYDLMIVKDSRDGFGRPLFDAQTNTIFGRSVVINDSLTRVIYGDWNSGCFLRRTGFVLLLLREAFSSTGELGFKGTTFADQKFLASVPSVTVQPLYFTNLETAGS